MTRMKMVFALYWFCLCPYFKMPGFLSDDLKPYVVVPPGEAYPHIDGT